MELSNLFRIRIGLFRIRALSKRLYSAKETYNLKEPTNRSQFSPNTYIHVNVYGKYAYMHAYICIYSDAALASVKTAEKSERLNKRKSPLQTLLEKNKQVVCVYMI